MAISVRNHGRGPSSSYVEDMEFCKTLQKQSYLKSPNTKLLSNTHSIQPSDVCTAKSVIMAMAQLSKWNDRRPQCRASMLGAVLSFRSYTKYSPLEKIFVSRILLWKSTAFEKFCTKL